MTSVFSTSSLRRRYCCKPAAHSPTAANHATLEKLLRRKLRPAFKGLAS